MIAKICLITGLALVALGLVGLFSGRVSKDDGALLIAGAILVHGGIRGGK